jgi:hypothetical protein
MKESQFLTGRESLLQDLASQLGSCLSLGKGLKHPFDELCHGHHESRVPLPDSCVEERAILDPLGAGCRLGSGGSRRGCQRVSRRALQTDAHSTPGYVVATNSGGYNPNEQEPVGYFSYHHCLSISFGEPGVATSPGICRDAGLEFSSREELKARVRLGWRQNAGEEWSAKRSSEESWGVLPRA